MYIHPVDSVDQSRYGKFHLWIISWGTPRHEVVLLFRGMFRDAGFARMLTAAFDLSGRRALEVVTVIADAQFDFPSVDVYDKEVP